MKYALTLLISVLGLSWCPEMAFAQFFNKNDQKQFPILSDPQKLKTIQELIQASSPSQYVGIDDLKKEDFQKELKLSIEAHLQKLESEAKLLKIGGVDSGGGNLLLLKDGQVRLLDHYVYGIARKSAYPSMVLPNTKALQDWGVDKLDLDSLKLRDLLVKKVKAWSSSSPFMVSLLSRAIKNIPIYITTHEIAVQDHQYYIPKELDRSKIQSVVTSAFYIEDFGVFISKQWFERLSYEDQIGLLLHESLRHIQISFEFQNSNRSLQKLTAALMRGPDRNESLDTAEYMDGKLIVQLMNQAQRESIKLLILTQACSAYAVYLKKPCPLHSFSIKEMDRMSKELHEYALSLNSVQEENYKVTRACAWELSDLAELTSQTEMGKTLDGMMDTEIPLLNIGNGNFIDLACDDFNKHSYFWSPFKKDAQKLLIKFRNEGIIR